MERNKSVAAGEEQKIRWKKIGGGSLWLLGHIIKPGQVFYAKPSDISEAFRDQIVPVDGIPAPNTPPVVGKVSTYKMQPKGKSPSLWEVVNVETGKAVNEKGVTKEKAEAILQDLQA
jgi:hypothetical protein